MDVIQNWWKQSFSNPQIVLLVLLLVTGVALVTFAGDVMGPLIVSLIIAYLLDGGISFLRRMRIPGWLALTSVYSAFLVFSAVFLLLLIPVLYKQLAGLMLEVPAIFAKSKELLSQLPQKYPELFSESQISELITSVKTNILDYGEGLLAVSISTLTSAISALIYLVLVPLIIFFMLKDKRQIWRWVSGFFPSRENQALTRAVWGEVNLGIAGYLRGKAIEIALMWATSWLLFYFLGLNYAPLLSFLVGLSVIIPLIGIVAVTIPVALVAYVQWGITSDFYYLIGIYFALQFVDANILVPLLFSEAVNLHPIAIILAVLAFGSIWGIWGVFFAIPLATLVNAILKAWPRQYLESRKLIV